MERSEYMQIYIKRGERGESMGRKKILGMVLAILVCVTFSGSAVYASSGHRRDGISSRGAINYDQGGIVIDSADLITLADEMDELEGSFKTNIVDALDKIGTYMRQDGSISHTNRADIDPLQLAFRNLEAGILKSQSVAHLADTQASHGQSPLFYKFPHNNLLEVTDDDTGMPVFIVPATEDNLTVQTAGWVDGHCLAGNGSDNYYFYQKGFIEGYAAKIGATVEYQYDDTGKIKSANLIFRKEN